jgi:hypothetical protein
MRRHFLDCMNIGPDDRAPAPYQASDGPIAEDQPLRMEWHKTVIQSKHNQAMRSRVIDSLRSHRKQYPHVPTSAFADDKSLESCYDACFATMRNKWKLQNPSAAPSAANGDGPDTDPIVAGPKVLTKKGIRQRRLARKKAVCSTPAHVACSAGAHISRCRDSKNAKTLDKPSSTLHTQHSTRPCRSPASPPTSPKTLTPTSSPPALHLLPC